MISNIFFTAIASLLMIFGFTPCEMPNDAPSHCYTTNDEGIESGIADIFF